MQGLRDEIVENKSMGRRLIQSAKEGSLEIVEKLLSDGAPINFLEQVRLDFFVCFFQKHFFQKKKKKHNRETKDLRSSV